MIGAHLSIAGGLPKAIERGEALSVTALQIFTKSNHQWRARPLPDDEIEDFQTALEASSIRAVVAHAAYLINLASPEEGVHGRSIRGLSVELARCDRIGIPVLVLHPGAARGRPLDEAIGRIADSLDRMAEEGHDTRVALETTAGQGTSVGHRFEHLRDILGAVNDPDRVGVCLDTCHLFAAGYDLRTEEAYAETMDRFDRIVGLDKVEAVHCNDSKRALGSRVDRHEHIGKGELGLDAFRHLMRDERFFETPILLETPKEGDMDPVNLGILRRLREGED